MKKGLMIATAVTLSVSIGAVLAVMSNKSSLAFKTAKESVETTLTQNSFKNSTQGAHLAGNAVYFVDSSEERWWGKLEAKTAFYFFSENATEPKNTVSAWSDSVVASVSWNRNNNGGDVYEGIVPEVPANVENFTTWQYVIAVRMPKGKTTGTFDDKYNQSSNISLGSGNNAVFLSQYGESYSGSTITAVERLEILSWAQAWSKPSQAGSMCDHNGNTDVSTLHDQWEATGSKFISLGDDVKYAFSHQAAEPDTEETYTSPTAGDFAARYDWIYGRYSSSCNLSNWGER